MMKLGVNKCGDKDCGLVLFTLGDRVIHECPVCNTSMRRVGSTQLTFIMETGIHDEPDQESIDLLLGH